MTLLLLVCEQETRRTIVATQIWKNQHGLGKWANKIHSTCSMPFSRHKCRNMDILYTGFWITCGLSWPVPVQPIRMLVSKPFEPIYVCIYRAVSEQQAQCATAVFAPLLQYTYFEATCRIQSQGMCLEHKPFNTLSETTNVLRFCGMSLANSQILCVSETVLTCLCCGPQVHGTQSFAPQS